MLQFNPQPEIPPDILATDLDGTFIPLGESPEDEKALNTIGAARKTGGFKLVYATGRHYSSVMEAIESFGLPVPDWIICDVGSSIYQSNRIPGGFVPYVPYGNHLQGLVRGTGREQIEELLDNISGLALQSPERQQAFKISYECASGQLDAILEIVQQHLARAGVPYTCTGSVDPFEKCGLLDVLPENVSKAYALIWLSSHADFRPDEVIFAGDSGNDLAALVSGFRAIVVGNASAGLAEKVQAEMARRGLEDRLYRAPGQATSGVLEGCRHFRLF